MNKLYTFIIIAILFFAKAGTLFAQEANENISNAPFFDAEPSIAIDPMNSNNLVVAWMGITGLKVTIHSKASTDGGKTWSTLQTHPHFSNTFGAADVSVAYNRKGEAFLCYVDYKAVTGADSGVVAVARSKNGGESWEQPVIVRYASEDPELALDRPWIAVDNSGGQFDGTIYVSTKPYFANVTAPNHTHLKHSTDDGLSWSQDVRVDDSTFAPSNAGSMGVMSVGPNSTLGLVYFSFNPKFQFLPRLIYCSSTDGGQTLTRHTVSDYFTILDSNYQFGYALALDPSHAGRAVTVWIDTRFGDPDVVSSFTTDAGVTWSTPVRVNDDAAKNGIGQDMVWCDFSANGKLTVAWRDRRNGGIGDTARWELYTATSSDGGASFSKNLRISDAPSNYNQITKGNDFIGVVADSGKMHFVWGDYTTNWDILYSAVSLSGPSSVSELLQKQTVLASYPNPTMGVTNIGFTLATSSAVSLRVLDVNGRTELNFPPKFYGRGDQTISFDARSLPEGSYFYELSTDSGIQKGKVAVVR